ncbi:MAG: YggS family pyridoxal phosphate-dependent enzyme [Rhodospirillales bacterium]|nr:YggS family pyridoxal phosphate-dependent enzyme [Alphaproteobacteria bacterium]USO04103.1 MAG: YggS family pyridoxal phosphate-dependent enzyme [Rhodospirillales bacterium]
MNQVAENIAQVREKIGKAARAANRKPEDVHLVAVSKRQPPEKISAALEAGQRLFGENRVQEAQDHWAQMKPEYPDLKLHLIGPLQTNKVKEALRLFDAIETVDRPKLVMALAREMKKQGRFPPCFVQVNTGEEPQKAGVAPDDLPALLALCRDEGVSIRGLMCIPPFDEPAALHFALLAKLAKENGLKDLSMGMSADFEKAVPFGATHVRVGTFIFGAREG